MWRFAELLLFLAPFAAFALWRVTASSGGPSTVVIASAAAAVVVLFLSLLVFSRRDALTGSETYVPAHIENGRLVEGHGAKRP